MQTIPFPFTFFPCHLLSFHASFPCFLFSLSFSFFLYHTLPFTLFPFLILFLFIAILVPCNNLLLTNLYLFLYVIPFSFLYFLTSSFNLFPLFPSSFNLLSFFSVSFHSSINLLSFFSQSTSFFFLSNSVPIPFGSSPFHLLSFFP